MVPSDVRQFLPLSLVRQRIENVLWEQGDRIERNAQRIFDSIDDRRRRAIHWQFTNPFRAVRPVNVTQLLEVNPNRSQIGGRRDNVVCHLAVLHSAFLPNHLFVKREPNSLSYPSHNLPFSQDGMQHSAYLL